MAQGKDVAILVSEMLKLQVTVDTAKDITTRTKANRQLQRMYKQNEALAQAHGIRNPFVTTGV